MKKLALILALAMSCNLFTAMNVSAAMGEAPTISHFDNFDQYTSRCGETAINKWWSTEEPDGFENLTGDKDNQQGYDRVKLNTSRYTGYTGGDTGISWTVLNTGAFRYNFGGKILGTATVSFDYLVGDNSARKGSIFNIAVNDATWGTEDAEGTKDWDYPLMSVKFNKIYDRNTGLYTTKGVDALEETVNYDEWNKVKFVIHGTENSVSIERWLNGVRIDRKDTNGNYIPWTGSNEVGVYAISFFGEAGVTSEPNGGNEITKGIFEHPIDNFEVTYRNSTDVSPTTATAKTSAQYMVSTGNAIVITLSSPVDPATVPAKYIISGTSNYDNTPISSIANAALSNNNKTITLTGMNGYATYTSLLPEGILGASGEEIVMSTESVWFNDVENDHFEDFEGYTVDQKMRGLRTESGSNKFAASDARVIGTTYGQSLKCLSKGLQYFLNGNVDTGKYVFSYDVYDEGTSSNNKETHSMGIKYNFKNNETFNQTGTAITGYVIDQDKKIQIQGNNTNFVKSGEQDYLFPQNQWVHIDVVLEYPASGEPVQTLYVNGDKLHSDTLNTTLNNVAYTKANGYKFAAFFLDQGNNRQYHIDNVHRREFGGNTASFELNADRTGGTLTFEDAVDADTLTSDNLIITEYQGEEPVAEITVNSKTIYGAEITFGEALAENKKYTILVDAKSYAEETISNIDFDTTEVFEIEGVELFGGTVMVGNAADWKDDAAQTYIINVNSTVPAKSAVIIAAGYKDSGALTGVVIDDVSLTDGEVTGDFDVLDMDGATSIKLFVIDSLTNLSPYLLTPVTL